MTNLNSTSQIIESTRNAVVVQDTVSQNQTITASSSRVEKYDPLAQTFQISESQRTF